MTLKITAAFSGALLVLAAASTGHAEVSAADRTFVGNVSQGGMFEAVAGKLAERKAVAQDVKDFAHAEVHDHDLVNGKLKFIAERKSLPIAGALNPELQDKLDKLNAMSGAAFDVGYMQSMGEIHKKDGGLFAQEAQTGADPDLKAFATETVLIVDRHIGAIHGAAPQ